MSYDISLIDPKTNKVALMKDSMFVRGGTVPANKIAGKLHHAAQKEASINITYNYSKYYYEATDGDDRFAHDEISCYYADGTTGPIKTEYGIRGLYGKTGAESVSLLGDMIIRIKQKYTDENGNWLTDKRSKVIYYDEYGNEVDHLNIYSGHVKVTEKKIEYEVSEGDTDNYWERTAANAIKALEQMLFMALECLDSVWEGD